MRGREDAFCRFFEKKLRKKLYKKGHIIMEKTIVMCLLIIPYPYVWG